MGTITLSSEDSRGNSILSNIFIDHYMPEANGTFVKVYLYLLRLQQSNRGMCSLTEIADHLNCTDNDVSRAIKYWIGKGLLQYSSDEKGNPTGLILCQPQNPDAPEQPSRIVDFRLLRQEEPKKSAGRSAAAKAAATDAAADSAVAGASMTGSATVDAGVSGSAVADSDVSASAGRKTSGNAAGKASSTKKSSGKQPSVKELEQALTDPQFMELRAQAEAYFDRPLTDKDINALWYIYDDLKTPFELCEYLLEYCAEGKGKHPERMQAGYYQKIAASWAEQGIRTREEAREATNRRFFGTQILRALGIRDRYVPTDAEVRMIENWRTRFGFSDEMLVLACETALRRKPGSVGYDYVEGIMESWHKQGLTTPEDVERLDHARTTERKSSAKRSQPNFLEGSLSGDLDLIEQLSAKKAKES